MSSIQCCCKSSSSDCAEIIHRFQKYFIRLAKCDILRAVFHILCAFIGTCIPGAKTLTCNCPALFSGRRCEVDLCTCIPCSDPQDQDCKCPLQRPPECLDSCHPGGCINGGRCVNIDGKSLCQ
jgi:hypothetical protein